MNLFMGSWINHWSQIRLRVANSYCQRWLCNTIHVNDMVHVYIKVGYNMVYIMVAGYRLNIEAAATQQTRKTRVQYLLNVGPTSKTLGRHSTNVIQMFCVCWEAFFAISSICHGCVYIPYHIYLPVNMTHPPNVEQCWASVVDGRPTLV